MWSWVGEPTFTSALTNEQENVPCTHTPGPRDKLVNQLKLPEILTCLEVLLDILAAGNYKSDQITK